MAASDKIYSAVRVDQPRDFTVDGKLVTAQAGAYLLTDADSNVTIISSSEYEQEYADAGTGVAGEVYLVKPKRKGNEDEQELVVTAPEVETLGDVQEPKPPATKSSKKAAVVLDTAPQDAGNGSKASEVTGADPSAKVGPAETGDEPPTSNQ